MISILQKKIYFENISRKISSFTNQITIHLYIKEI